MDIDNGMGGIIEQDRYDPKLSTNVPFKPNVNLKKRKLEEIKLRTKNKLDEDNEVVEAELPPITIYVYKCIATGLSKIESTITSLAFLGNPYLFVGSIDKKSRLISGYGFAWLLWLPFKLP